MKTSYDRIFIEKINKLIQSGDDEETLHYLEEMQFCKPSLIVLNNLGWFYMRIGTKDIKSGQWFYNPEKAIKPLYKATKLSKKSHYPFTNLGEAYIKNGEYIQAKEILYRSVNIEKSIVNQNNLAYAAFACKQYEEAERIQKELLNDLEKNNIYNTLKKICKNTECLEIFVMLYNYACILGYLKQYTKIKKIADELLEFYNLDILSVSDIDIIDIMSLYYLCNDFEKVIALNPQNGFVINKQIFSICCTALINLGRTNEAKEYFEKTINEVNEMIKDYKENVEEPYKEFLLTDCLKRKQDFLDVYEIIIKNPLYKIEILPRIIESNYFFR